MAKIEGGFMILDFYMLKAYILSIFSYFYFIKNKLISKAGKM